MSVLFYYLKELTEVTRDYFYLLLFGRYLLSELFTFDDVEWPGWFNGDKPNIRAGKKNSILIS